MNTRKLNLRDYILCALFAAIIAICAWISIPVLEIAFTMQTFAVCLTLGVLGGKRGTLAIICYILLGAVGVPVFAGFRGGVGVLLGVTGGYILGFLASGPVYWAVPAWLGERGKLLGMVLALLACYAFGSAWFMILYLQQGTVMGLGTVLMTCVVPYLIPDALKVALAMVLSQRLKRFADGV